uniref:Pentatricopeptide repeat-containing protein n=1 Tax=Populus alba TaxID=43335 RepID=A0A4U5QJZ7_POPAL|nr:hypothetical protein D5086_0000076260 [Populus alba]
MSVAAIRTFKYASSSNLICNSDAGMSLFDTEDIAGCGYCRMRRVERAIELVDEMKREGIRSNAIVCNPIIDALAEAGRFKEVLEMMEHFFLCETGPSISTYNSYEPVYQDD